MMSSYGNRIRPSYLVIVNDHHICHIR
jgi:hypothetical protein